jgi:hypothetical protein
VHGSQLNMSGSYESGRHCASVKLHRPRFQARQLLIALPVNTMLVASCSRIAGQVGHMQQSTECVNRPGYKMFSKHNPKPPGSAIAAAAAVGPRYQPSSPVSPSRHAAIILQRRSKQ